MNRFHSIGSQDLIEFLRRIESLSEQSSHEDAVLWDESEFDFDDEFGFCTTSSSVLRREGDQDESPGEAESR